MQMFWLTVIVIAAALGGHFLLEPDWLFSLQRRPALGRVYVAGVLAAAVLFEFVKHQAEVPLSSLFFLVPMVAGLLRGQREGLASALLAAFVWAGTLLIQRGALPPLTHIGVALTLYALVAATSGQVTDRLRQLANTDGLTGISNRRSYFDRLEADLGRCRRHGLPLAVLIIDVDHFKAYNDSLGHREGDLALQRVADLLQRSLRGGDYLARYGGEEFIITLPGANQESALGIAERLRQAVELMGRALPRPVTVSVGLACYPEFADAEALIRAADNALYQAKGMRNMVATAYEPQQATLALE